eukprot:2558879-Prorocentrum_lima.AAC.1
MTSSLVGSEMCIRDRPLRRSHTIQVELICQMMKIMQYQGKSVVTHFMDCLLYTSDAADDM